jgi:flagellar protein FliS
MNGFDAYRETQVTTQSPGRLIVMLYEGAIRFLKQAVVDIENKDYAAKGKNIGKAQDIITELNVVLNMEAGEVSDNLRSLYNFMNRHLGQANIKKDPEMIREVISILEELNQSWKAIAS